MPQVPTATAVKPLVASSLLLMTLVALSVYVLSVNGPTGWDESVTSWMLAHRSAGVTTVAEFVSTVMSPIASILIALAVGGLLWRRDRTTARGLALVLTVVSADALTEVLKILVHRTRPPLSWQLEAHELAGSFPSGHTTGAAALAFGLAVVLLPRASIQARRQDQHRGRAVVAIAVAIVVAVSVAASRVYLGMHWATDVTAGLLVGLIAALLVPAILNLLTSQHQAGKHSEDMHSAPGPITTRVNIYGVDHHGVDHSNAK
ncbi:phosphatase PAP2 family protein [Gordonia sp. (in: high G+C Gram-positive bacteria)]|uniref:phosphatase PAP2 family protein n=1 Tax=Gordonia sp. (in: high G+C Gram-positive bacteria) TaxID=84139 RepID=UPI003C75D604